MQLSRRALLLPTQLSALFLATMLASSAALPAEVESQGGDSRAAKGRELWNTHCVSCHSGSMLEAPQASALEQFDPARIVTALTSGIMSVQGLPLARTDMHDLAYFLTGKDSADGAVSLDHAFCEGSARRIALDGSPSDGFWSSWGNTLRSARHQADERRLTPANVKSLSLKWAFAFPGTTRVRSQPVITSDTVFIGSQTGTVYALDRETGCIKWTFEADAEVRGSLSLHQQSGSDISSLQFGDFKANAYSIDAQTGALRWKTRVHPHPLATITGSVIVAGELAYVPVSSSEVVPAAQPEYPCCSFRGAVVAVDMASGTPRWRTYTTDEPTPRGKTRVGTPRLGPSGAPIWSTPSFDAKRDLLIVTTGQNYSSPATNTSDAVIALDAKSGDIRWVTQVTANDAWNGACSRGRPNCPEENGPDFDIGAAAILTTTAEGRDLILVGQKSGLVYGLDAEDNGKLLWTTRVGRGGTMGGVHWGMSSDAQRLYVGVSDLPTGNAYTEGDPFPGVHALNPETGDILWRTVLPDNCPADVRFRCHPGISAAVSSSPGLVYAGGMDGILRILDAADGGVLWSYDTRRSYQSITGVDGQGGSIESDGPVISDGDVFVTSGYDKWAEQPGNVLLVFTTRDTGNSASTSKVSAPAAAATAR